MSALKTLVTGGTGFVGTKLTGKLTAKGFKVAVLTRSIGEGQAMAEGISFLEGDPRVKGGWQERVADYDIIINLAGASIFSRWTAKRKRLIRDSRILTTRNLVDAISRRKGKKTILLSTSAVGYYGFHGDEALDEGSPAGDDFLATLSQDWESSALEAEKYGVRVVCCRFGIVLGSTFWPLSRTDPNSPIFSFNIKPGTAGRKVGFPRISPSTLVSSLLVTGFGAVQFTGPEISSRSIKNK